MTETRRTYPCKQCGRHLDAHSYRVEKSPPADTPAARISVLVEPDGPFFTLLCSCGHFTILRQGAPQLADTKTFPITPRAWEETSDWEREELSRQMREMFSEVSRLFHQNRAGSAPTDKEFLPFMRALDSHSVVAIKGSDEYGILVSTSAAAEIRDIHRAAIAELAEDDDDEARDIMPLLRRICGALGRVFVRADEPHEPAGMDAFWRLPVTTTIQIFQAIHLHLPAES